MSTSCLPAALPAVLPAARPALMPSLTDFLRSRRARLGPADVGLAGHATRRRVPGLRREELAERAHISLSYYIRLEQGRVGNVSDDVLDSIADALLLDGRDRARLFDIVRSRTQRPAPEIDGVDVSPIVCRFVSELEVPAWLESCRGDILAWSRSYHAVFAWRHDYSGPENPTGRPNVVRAHFLDPAARSLYVHWRHWAAVFVGQLWEEASRRPTDRRLGAFVAEMCRRSPEFAELWSAGAVDRPDPDSIELLHPTMGRLSMKPLVFRVEGGADVKLSMAAWTTSAGS